MQTQDAIDITPVVAAVVEVALDPYKALVEKLETQGRLSDDELAELDRRVRDVDERLPELAQAALAELRATA
jgi:prefoldin subunit 5